MGYSEVLCHLCGVSFNIGRIRTATEPRSAAWSPFGIVPRADSWRSIQQRQESSYVRNEIHNGRVDHGCDRDSGCMFARRRERVKEDENTDHVLAAKALMEEDVSDDESWFQGDDSDDVDPLEFCSEQEADEVLDKVWKEDVEMPDANDGQQQTIDWSTTREFWLAGILKYSGFNHGSNYLGFAGLLDDTEGFPAWYRGIPNYITLPDPDNMTDEIRPLFVPGQIDPVDPEDILDEDFSNWKALKISLFQPAQELDPEHIAGPGCKNLRGYKGHEISAEEMRSCHTLQCLVRKPKGWTFDPLPDDEDFERNGEFFLSGLSDHMPSRDYSIPKVTPARHGCSEPHAENSMFDEAQAYDYSMPFHPSCFEIYKRASTLNGGVVDVTGLTSWWSLEADYHYFHDDFPRNPDVGKCAMQEWDHLEGTAYLAANPLYVPKLESIFQDAISSDLNFDTRNGAFALPNAFAQQPTDDPFAILPAELQYQILDELSSKDIAALRLSVRTCYQLPISYFQKLLLREMPWLWEAWPTNVQPSQTPYAKWATATAEKLDRTLQKPEKEAAALIDYVNIVKEEMPELGPILEEKLSPHLQAVQDAWFVESAKTLVQNPFYLPPDRTDYFKLYTLLTRHWTELRGLQNRKRIWTGCEEILRRIDKYKEEGRIDEDGITEPLENVVKMNREDHNRRMAEHRQRWKEARERSERSANPAAV
ncbi:hypothetical protein K491DRAFT_713996 [Lophiostoma macrostomum CBS 122681]|uniref:F-box domain-containing protein n=1 Tax=Lophiostoma macrostomum CBS 122681 TaxID=1314788 RepID=A0A6A6TGX3_9PLEO|nr:hypothetical protein K491DRAFT_713996 [Lophiostoma macrostomum CBS 122681]